MNFSFYILGIPTKFEIYPNKKGKVQYFKRFNDGSKENMKLVMHIVDNETISYSYIRNNLLSSNGKPAFFGMSLEFTKTYCTDVQLLYKGLDKIYNEIVLKIGILFHKTNGQTQFTISSFKNEKIQKEIEKNITYAVERFIENELTGKFKVTNKSFKPNTTSILKKLNISKSNDEILKMMKKYDKIAISPEYQETTVAKKKVEVEESEKEMEKQTEKSTTNSDRGTLLENGTNKEKQQSPFKDKWVLFWIVIAAFSSIWLIISIYKIVKLWIE
jgi:hypothetical protein